VRRLAVSTVDLEGKARRGGEGNELMEERKAVQATWRKRWRSAWEKLNRRCGRRASDALPLSVLAWVKTGLGDWGGFLTLITSIFLSFPLNLTFPARHRRRTDTVYIRKASLQHVEAHA
jgi:hypothetical protein